MTQRQTSDENPMPTLDDWDDDVRRRYNAQESKKASQFRDYGDGVRPAVREFYRLNHQRQTVDFVQAVRKKYLPLRTRRMGIWEAMEYLNQLVDDSDPDIELPQIAHAMQTAESIRADGHPRWFIATGLLHDMGKVLCLFGEPQWAVTGDTFPVGCRFSEKIVFHEFFADNPDANVADYQTVNGIYSAGCGLDNVLMSWGHDEYLYYVIKDYLPLEAQYMIRFHSFYPGHREGEYEHLMNQQDREMFRWVRKFNPYDLYTKTDQPPDVAALMPYYQELIAEFFPAEIQW